MKARLLLRSPVFDAALCAIWAWGFAVTDYHLFLPVAIIYGFLALNGMLKDRG